MGAARIHVELQAILVIFLLLLPPFLPSVLAAGASGGGNSGELVAGDRPVAQARDTTLLVARNLSRASNKVNLIYLAGSNRDELVV
uniref:rRNA N-glycosidase n=1 Tax=Leersia perrieri TaxID=77586 RepID=A0A0D9VDN4_9ORYZ